MANPKSSFIIKHYEGFGGNFVDSQYLTASFDGAKPYEMENTLMKVYSSNSRYFTSKPLLGMLGNSSFGTKEITGEVYRWRMQDAEIRYGIQVENLESGNAAPGLNNTTFRIKTDIGYYAHPDVIFSEDNTKPLAIQEGPFFDGTGNVYVVKIQSDNPALYLDPKYLEQGRRFNKVWTSVPSEANEWYGTQQTASTMMLEHQISYFANSIKVTDRALREQGRLGIDFIATNSKGQEERIKTFIPYYEAKMRDEFYRSMDVQMVYGTKSTSTGKNGYWIKTGAGLREQVKDGWVDWISTPPSVNYLKDYLMTIFNTRTDENNRKVFMMTGTIGALQFHDAIVAVANGFLTVDTNWTRRTDSGIGTPGLEYGAQYTRYFGPEGIVINVMRNPMYNSLEFCGRTHPLYPEFPIDSARLTFLDFGTSGGENNIMMIKEKDSFRYAYVQNMVGPNGPVTGGPVTSTLNYYETAIMGSAGIWVKDATRCGEIITDFD
ncbi:hypothetical protein EKK58_12950 [Candidatus Dependentiae bacterium]|nr:MAG: hypothetical protein EKK58_12950 [Candidatus Dependentiae bacterium]